MGLFDKLREPVVLKENSDSKKQLEQLNTYLQTAPKNIKAQIEQDIRLLQYGIYGEDALMFELKNSHMPMYILHDLFFEMNDLKTQIDYIVVTRKTVIIMECKNLYGNISIDENGNFTRTVQFGTRYNKMGIYSPVTQNQRHIDMIHELRRATKPVLLRSAFDKNFDEVYKSVIVLSNPNSILDMRYAPKAIKNKVIKADGIINYIKTLNETSKAKSRSDKEMKELADFFLEISVPNTKDYIEKYKKLISDTAPEKAYVENAKEKTLTELIKNEFVLPQQNIESTPVYQALKTYRYNKSKQEGIKAYFIYNNAQLEEIIRTNPTTINELKLINGFGDIKCAKYGEDILKLLSEYRFK